MASSTKRMRLDSHLDESFIDYNAKDQTGSQEEIKATSEAAGTAYRQTFKKTEASQRSHYEAGQHFNAK